MRKKRKRNNEEWQDTQGERKREKGKSYLGRQKINITEL
jgi:hypothetical protein